MKSDLILAIFALIISLAALAMTLVNMIVSRRPWNLPPSGPIQSGHVTFFPGRSGVQSADYPPKLVRRRGDALRYSRAWSHYASIPPEVLSELVPDDESDTEDES